MTIKDIADRASRFGLVCQKCVHSFDDMRAFQTICPSVSRLARRPSLHISEHTRLAATSKTIILSCSAIRYQARQPTTTSFPHSTPVPAAIPTHLPIGSQTLEKALQSGISRAPQASHVLSAEPASAFVTMSTTTSSMILTTKYRLGGIEGGTTGSRSVDRRGKDH